MKINSELEKMATKIYDIMITIISFHHGIVKLVGLLVIIIIVWSNSKPTAVVLVQLHDFLNLSHENALIYSQIEDNFANLVFCNDFALNQDVGLCLART